MTSLGSTTWSRWRWLPVLVGLLMLPLRAWAAPSIEMQVDPPEVAMGERATVTVTVSDAMGGRFSPPTFGELHVMGPEQSNQSVMSLSGGSMSVRSSTVYTWFVDAVREGTFKIGPAKLVYHGDTYMTEPGEVRVSGAAQPRPPPPQPRSPFAMSPFSSPFDPLDQIDDMQRRRHSDQDVFLKVVVDKTEPYLGEQVTLSLYLFADVDVTGVSTVSFPKLDGFWAEDVETPTQLVPEVRTYNGHEYNVFLLRRRALFPLQAGETTVDPVEAQVTLGLRMFPAAQDEVVKRKTQPVKLTVKPLPTAGQPPGFETANVGLFKFSSSATPLQTTLGQPIQFKASLEVFGNLKNVHLPKFTPPDGLKTFDPTVTDKVHVSGGRYGGTKDAEWVLIPERTGDFEIPAIELPYFDTTAQTYAVARTQPMTVHVAAGAAPAATSSGQVPPAVAQNVLSSGLRPIRLHGDLSAVAVPLWQRSFFWPIALTPVVLFGLLWGGAGAMSMWRRRDPEQLRIKRAHSAASRRLKAAREMLTANDPKAFYAEVIRALQQFVTDKAGVAALGLTREELGRTLTERGFPQGPVRALVSLLETCETARFSPTAAESSSMANVLERSQEILDALESARTGARAA